MLYYCQVPLIVVTLQKLSKISLVVLRDLSNEDDVNFIDFKQFCTHFNQNKIKKTTSKPNNPEQFNLWPITLKDITKMSNFVQITECLF